jgi:hypothetical protein
MNLQTVRRLQKDVHRLPYFVKVFHYIRVLSSSARLSLTLRLSAVPLPTYLTIFQLYYCLHISPIFQLCYCVLISPIFQLFYRVPISPIFQQFYRVLISPIFQLCYCLLISSIFQAPSHNQHRLYIFLFL